ncbi:MAG: AAA family ATPase [bacterium]
MQQILGTIKNIVYQNKENGYTVIRTTKNETLCGMLSEPGVNLTDAEFIAKGDWQRHKKFGNQFLFEEFKVNESDLFYFLSRIVKGVGKKLSKTLIDQYGEKGLEDTLDNNPTELIKIKGIKEKKLKKITANWNKFKDLKNLAEALVPYGASQILVNKTYRHFKEDKAIVEKIKENPYLITEVKGIGFKTADRISRDMGIAPHSHYRIRACIDFLLLNYTATQGNSCIKETVLYELLDEEIAFADSNENKNSITVEQFKEVLTEMEKERDIQILPEEKITSTYLYHAEKSIFEIAKNKGSLRTSQILLNIEGYIVSKEKEMGILFSKEQKAAIKVINEGYQFFILCGYAGTGKSVISKAILDLVSKVHHKELIMCCALSGIASDRIRKTSGYQAATLQGLLVKAEKEGGTLPYKVILIDESSMVNSEVFYRIFKAFYKDTVFILVGDPAQLPPIGAGDPFHDLIKKKVAPIVELTKIYRQSEEKVITYFANQIREARVPENYRGMYEDFEFIDISIPNYFALKKKLKEEEMKKLRDENSQKILKYIIKIAKDFKKELSQFLQIKDIKNFITCFQLISPLKNGVLGTDNLNNELQNTINPQTEQQKIIDLNFVKFYLFDKVIHIINQDMDCYTPQDFKSRDRENKIQRKRIFNGMIGLLFAIDHEEELLWVFYPNDDLVVEYTFDDARELLKLAYALTIHKTQGSEFRKIIIPITFSHFIMLNNKLLYTAVTRAKEKCIIVGENYAFESACRRKDVTIRDTVISMLNGEKNG